MDNRNQLPWNPTVERIYNELQVLRQSSKMQDVVGWILSRLRSVDDLASKMLLLSELAGEYDLRGDYVSAEHHLHERISLSDNAASSWISLADHYLFVTQDIAAAALAAQNALDFAVRQKAFIRQAAGTRIRAALALDDYSCVEKTLRLLLTDEAQSSKPDTAFETDFVHRIPPGMVNAQLIKNYMELAERHKGITNG